MFCSRDYHYEINGYLELKGVKVRVHSIIIRWSRKGVMGGLGRGEMGRGERIHLRSSNM